MSGPCALVLRRPAARVGGPDAERRGIGGKRLADLRKRSHKIIVGLRYVLVRDVQFVFESIQFRFLVDLPPLPTERGILRLGRLPGAAVRSLLSRCLLESRRRWHYRTYIFWTNIASQH